jgi:tetratricopeptide (TPR) repeat protein
VNLNRLSNRETLSMAAYILGTEVMGEDLEELILNKTEGIPFFVEEFMKSLKDLGMIEWRDSGYYLAKDIQEVEIPSTIQEVIMARVDSLPDGAKSVLQTGSAIGREFSCELIKRVTGISTPEMTPHLSVLRDSELLYERGIFPQATYIFRHSLTQEVAYDSLLQKKKQEIHQRIGQAIEELYPDRLEEFYEMLAYHYSKSENWEKAYQYLRLSGDKTSLRYSTWESFRFYKEAINVLNKLPDTEENKRRGIEIRLLIADPMASLGFPEDSLQILQEGERLAREIGDDRSLARIYSDIGYLYSFRGDPLQGQKYTENAFEEAEKMQDIELMAPIAYKLCMSYIMAADYLKVAEIAPKIIALLEKTHKESEFFGMGLNPYCSFLSQHAHVQGWLGNFEEGEALSEKAISFACEINNLFNLMEAEFACAWVYHAKGDGKNVIEHCQKAYKYAEEMQVIVILASLWTGVGWGYYLLGDLENAQKYAEEGLEIQNEAGVLMNAFFPHWVLGLVHLDSGELENARKCMEEALKISESHNEKHAEGASRFCMGRILGKIDTSQSEKAEEYILQGITILEELKMKPWSTDGYLFLGELYADSGQKEKALEILKKAEIAFQDMGMDYWLRRTQEVLGRL